MAVVEVRCSYQWACPCGWTSTGDFVEFRTAHRVRCPIYKAIPVPRDGAVLDSFWKPVWATGIVGVDNDPY